jgi:hypothetical protein
MTRDETIEILAVIRLLWPHSNLGTNPVEVIGIWHSMLHDTDRRQVELAVREAAANGREHAPPVGVIVKAVAEREEDVPDWDEVEREVRRALSVYRPSREEARTNPYAPPPPEFWSHPAIARFMQHSWDEWRTSTEGDRTFLAQQREAYKALRARALRAGSLRLVGAPRRRDLAKPDYLAALPSPGGEAA